MEVVGFVFFGFVILVVAIYSAVRARWRPYVLFVASVVFYAVLDGRLPFALAIPAVFDYLIARKIAATRERTRKKRWLWLAIAIDLLVLGSFKYADFFLHTTGALLVHLGVIDSSNWSLGLAFPLGLSYFIFKSISALIDVYRGKPAPGRWVDYATYLAFFPQLVAGPIERFVSFGPQLSAQRRASLDDLRRGVSLILFGLFKKLVVANNVQYVAQAVTDPAKGHVVGTLDALVAIYAYAWQMYADFSGYTDIANGVGACLGFKSVLNFNQPFFASRPSEFWRRWHVSLSSWVNDYVLFSLVGLRSRGLKLYAGVITSMIVIGIWHGPELAFAIFGLYHGMLLVLEMRLRTAGVIGLKDSSRSKAILAIVITFHLVAIGELLFATRSVSRAGEILASIFTGPLWTTHTTPIIVMFVVFVGPLAMLELFDRLKRGGIAGLSPVRRGLVYSMLVAAIALFGTPGGGVMYAGF